MPWPGSIGWVWLDSSETLKSVKYISDGGQWLLYKGALFSLFPWMSPVLGAGVWQEALTFSHVLTCFCVSFLVVLLAMTCLIFAVRLVLVTWRHCKRPLEESETPDPSGTVAWDLWHVVADTLKREKRIGHPLVLPSSTGCLVLFLSFHSKCRWLVSANLSCSHIPLDQLLADPPSICTLLHLVWLRISAGKGRSAEQPCAPLIIEQWLSVPASATRAVNRHLASLHRHLFIFFPW